ncbi:MAG: glutamate synthase, partial [bacterium]
MPARLPALTPWPLSLLLSRIETEWEQRRRIFDLPVNRFFKADPDCDLSLTVAGATVATPVGPAAGPHTQLAQNIVLGWLAGARCFELKTVQILDDLEIARPCIDMEAVGYNVEWSQELSRDESLLEYVKAGLLLHLLRRWEPLRQELGETGPSLFELSVGYDLAGIQSEPMTRFIAQLRDVNATVERLRSELRSPFAELLGDDFPRRLVSSATISSFHGCPPDEIEAIARHLMAVHGLDVIVKLNPTLLGLETTTRILRSELGYAEIRLVPEAFHNDLHFEAACGLIESLHDFARRHGRTFGIKLTNTLVVANHRHRLPGERMYLSGKPLHVLAMQLLDRLTARLSPLLATGRQDGPVPVAFSAGIDKGNLPAAVGLGLAP